MNTDALRTCYQGLAEAAASGPFVSAPVEEWPAEYVVAHAIATNTSLIWLGMHLLDGRSASYEGGTLSVQPVWLQSIVDSSGDFEGLIRTLRQSYQELIALASRFPDEVSQRLFPATIYDGRGRVLFSGEDSFEDLLLNKLTAHMNGHTQQIRDLVKKPSEQNKRSSLDR